MIRKLQNKNVSINDKDSFFDYWRSKINSGDKSVCINHIYEDVKNQKINSFYQLVGECFESIGFKEVSVTRDGDTNNRMDAIIIDDSYSIPIEIKSPREVEYVNIKSIRQALENKIVLLSRKFHNTTYECTSLAVAYDLPQDRSEVNTIVGYIYKSFGINVGYLDIKTLLSIRWNVEVDNIQFDLNDIRTLKGALNV
ncbi:hypothetical protein ACFLT1_08490 [Bacteroidota bacterium]